MLDRLTNQDLRHWEVFFAIYGFKIDREDRHMLHLCESAMEYKDAYKRALEYAKRGMPKESPEDAIWSNLRAFSARQNAVTRRG